MTLPYDPTLCDVEQEKNQTEDGTQGAQDQTSQKYNYSGEYSFRALEKNELLKVLVTVVFWQTDICFAEVTLD